jgi:putative endonuclease
MREHKNKTGSVFTRKYNVHELVYYEIYNSFSVGIKREKQLKEWKKEWKVELIKTMNPENVDLAREWI